MSGAPDGPAEKSGKPQADVEAHARTAVRNIGWLIVQRSLHICGGLLSAILLPRMMGPEVFGRYALVTSIALWFAQLSGLGAVPVMSRFVPQFLARDDKPGLQKLVSNMLTLRMGNGLLAAAVYLLLTALWLRELDWVALVFIASSVCVRTGGNLFFALFLGLNQAARWGTGEVTRRWGSLLFTVTGFLLAGLRGACLGLLLTEIVVWLVGFAWAHRYVSFANLRPDRQFLTPFLKFSIYFFAANLLLSLSQRSGETLVRLVSGDYTQVGYYGLAYGAYLLAAHAMWQLTMGFSPLLMMLEVHGETERLKAWVERLLTWLAAGGVLVIFAVLLLGDQLVPLILGAAYRPVARNLLPLTVALLTLSLGHVGRVLALTYDRPRAAITGAVVQFVTFWTLGPFLVSRGGSLAGCLAVLISSFAYAGYFTWRMRRDLPYSARGWGACILLALLFLPLLYVRGSLLVNAFLYTLFLGGYAGLLLITRLVTLTQLGMLRKAFRRPVAAIAGAESEPAA